MYQDPIQEARLLSERGIGDRVADPAALIKNGIDPMSRQRQMMCQEPLWDSRLRGGVDPGIGDPRPDAAVLDKYGLDPMSRYRHASRPVAPDPRPDPRLSPAETVTGLTGVAVVDVVRVARDEAREDLVKVRDEIVKEVREVNEKADSRGAEISAIAEDLRVLKVAVASVASSLKQRQTAEEQAQYQARLETQEMAGITQQVQQHMRLEMQDRINELKACVDSSLVRSIEVSQQKELENVDHLLRSYLEPFTVSKRKDLENVEYLFRSYFEPLKMKLDQSCCEINELMASQRKQLEAFRVEQLESSTVLGDGKMMDGLSRTFDALLRRHLDTLWKIALEKGEDILRQNLSPLHQKIQKLDLTASDSDRLTEIFRSSLSSHRVEIHQLFDQMQVDSDRLSQDMRNALVNQSSQISQLLDSSNRELSCSVNGLDVSGYAISRRRDRLVEADVEIMKQILEDLFTRHVVGLEKKFERQIMRLLNKVEEAMQQIGR